MPPDEEKQKKPAASKTEQKEPTQAEIKQGLKNKKQKEPTQAEIKQGLKNKKQNAETAKKILGGLGVLAAMIAIVLISLLPSIALIATCLSISGALFAVSGVSAQLERAAQKRITENESRLENSSQADAASLQNPSQLSTGQNISSVPKIMPKDSARITPGIDLNASPLGVSQEFENPNLDVKVDNPHP